MKIIDTSKEDSTIDTIKELSLPVIKFIAALTFVTTHPVLSQSVMRSNFKNTVTKNSILLFVITFSFSYIYTDNIASSIIIATLMIILRR